LDLFCAIISLRSTRNVEHRANANVQNPTW
jgi:hypothetical protein